MAHASWQYWHVVCCTLPVGDGIINLWLCAAGVLAELFAFLQRLLDYDRNVKKALRQVGTRAFADAVLDVGCSLLQMMHMLLLLACNAA